MTAAFRQPRDEMLARAIGPQKVPASMPVSRAA